MQPRPRGSLAVSGCISSREGGEGMQRSMDCLDHAASERYKCCCAKPKIYGYDRGGVTTDHRHHLLHLRCCFSSFAKEFCYLLEQMFVTKRQVASRSVSGPDSY